MSQIIEITDFHAEELEVYARLNDVQLRTYFEPARGIFIAESPNVITRALDAGYEPLSFLMERKHIERNAGELIRRFPDTPVYTAELDILTQLTGFPLTRGVLACMRRKTLPAVKDILSDAKRIAVLENIENPTNVGAIFRSAAALGMDAVLLTPSCTDPLYRRSARVSMGTVFQVPWTYIGEEIPDWPGKGLQLLKSLGFSTAAMALSDNSVSVEHPALKEAGKLAVILGTESEGLLPETIEACDYTVKIPMYHGVDSLNVAAASAVAFWELRSRN